MVYKSKCLTQLNGTYHINAKLLFSRVFQRKNPVIKIGLSGWAGGAFLVNILVNLFCRFNFLAKYSTCVLQISHMVSSGSLLSCDAMFFSVGSQFFGENAYFPTHFCVCSITPKLFKVFR